ncbi:hypothetical protein LCGC14_2444680, partial [marine sediment metagenome]
MKVSKSIMKKRSEVLDSFPVMANEAERDRILRRGMGAVWLTPNGWMDAILDPIGDE